jgi:DNA-binding MarR family transcriptional regulator
MLDKDHKRREQTLAKELERYLGKTLHADVRVRSRKAPAGIPAFLERTYKFYDAKIAATSLLIIDDEAHSTSPANLEKHMRLLGAVAPGTIIGYTATALSSRDRNRLIERGLPFVVPGNQVYIPELAIHLQERSRARRPARQDGGLSPAAQAVLLLHLLGKDAPPPIASALADRLHYTAMSIGRAFDELVALGLAEDERHGRERRIRFKLRGRQLLDAARDHLRSPVRAVKYVKGGRYGPPLKLAGESALAAHTDLSRPQMDTYAVATSAWKEVALHHRFLETDKYDAECIVETWGYDPAGLSAKPTVDPLSLYAQFKDDPDERIAGAAEQLLEEFAW